MDTQTEGKNMKEYEFSGISAVAHPETTLRSLTKPSQTEILREFSDAEQQTIRYRQRILSSIAFFIGKDFQIPVELNGPGQGWHWDFAENKIRIDPKDLLEEPMEKLRFKTAHEGGHRRISRTASIPLDEWCQPGFSFMMNAIEDPRDNNFVVEGYPKFQSDMEFTYNEDLDFEKKAKGKAKEELGYTPRFIQAGFAYIKQWFDEIQGKTPEIDEALPDEVQAVVAATRDSARKSYLSYPSIAGANGQESEQNQGQPITGEELVNAYAHASYVINRDHIWPEFKKLVEEDMKDQEMQELMGDMQKENGSGSGDGGSLAQGLKEQLSDEEQQELEKAIEQTMQKGEEGSSGTPAEETSGSGKPGIIDLDSLSDSLKQKIKDYIDSLPEEAKQELEKRAQEAIKDFEQEVNQDLEGKLSDNPDRKAARESRQPSTKPEESDKSDKDTPTDTPPQSSEDLSSYQELIEQALHKDENMYEQYRREVLPLIDTLESDLREIFVQRRSQKWQTGFRAGKKIDMQRRMQEEARKVSPVESRAWQKRELPTEKDYAISLLVDLSGSMHGQKIQETFKGAIVLAEVLNKLSINTEILGFNNVIHVYQAFGQDMSREVREHMGDMLPEVARPAGQWNDDGWAVEQASQRLAKQKASEKFLFVLSDGQPVPSPSHAQPRYELGTVVKGIMDETDQKLIGLGIGPGTGHVKRYYPNNIANIGVSEMSKQLAAVIREAIADYNAF